MPIRAIDQIGPAPSWLETDLSDLSPPLDLTARRVVGVKAVTGDGVLTVVNGEGEPQDLTLVEGDLENVEIQSITAHVGSITLLRVYYARGPVVVLGA